MPPVRIHIPQVGIPTPAAVRVPDTSGSIAQLSDKLFTAYDEMQRRDASVETAVTSSRLRSKYLNRVRQDHDNGAVGPNYTPTVLSELDDEIAGAVGGSGNSYARDALTAALADLRGDVETQALNVESTARRALLHGQMDEVLSNEISSVAAPGVTFDDAAARYASHIALVADARLPEVERQKRIEQARGIGDAYLSFLVSTNPQSVVDMLTAKDHPVRKMISTDHIPTILNQANAKIEQLRADENSALAMDAALNAGLRAKRVDDLKRSALETGLPATVAQLNEVFDLDMRPGPGTARERSMLISELDSLASLGRSVQGLASLPDAALLERAAQLGKDKAADVAGSEGFNQRAEQRDAQANAISKILKDRATDPAGALVASDPTVANAWSLADAEPGNQKFLADAVAATKAGHAVRGTPLHRRFVIDAKRAAAIASQLNSSGMSADEASRRIEFYSNALSPADWDKMFQSLRSNGLNDVMKIAATVNAPDKRALVIQYGRVKESEYKLERPEKVLGVIESDEAYEKFVNSLTNSGRGADIGALATALERYTLGEMAAGKTIHEAARNAIATIITDNYSTIKPGNNLVVRIPATAGVDPTRVRTTLDALIEHVGGYSGNAPVALDPKRSGSTGDPRIAPKVIPEQGVTLPSAIGGTPALVKRQQLEGIAANGGWIVNADESGVMMARGPGALVLDEKGRPIEYTWKDLEAASAPGVLWNTFLKVPPRRTDPPPLKPPVSDGTKVIIDQTFAPTDDVTIPNKAPVVKSPPPGGGITVPEGAAQKRARENAKGKKQRGEY